MLIFAHWEPCPWCGHQSVVYYEERSSLECERFPKCKYAHGSYGDENNQLLLEATKRMKAGSLTEWTL